MLPWNGGILVTAAPHILFLKDTNGDGRAEGQEVFAKADYIPAHPAVPASVPTLKPAEGKFRAHFFTPEQTEESMPKWNKVFSECFR